MADNNVTNLYRDARRSPIERRGKILEGTFPWHEPIVYGIPERDHNKSYSVYPVIVVFVLGYGAMWLFAAITL